MASQEPRRRGHRTGRVGDQQVAGMRAMLMWRHQVLVSCRRLLQRLEGLCSARMQRAPMQPGMCWQCSI